MVDVSLRSESRQYWFRIAGILLGMCAFLSLSVLMHGTGRTLGFQLIVSAMTTVVFILSFAFRPRDFRLILRPKSLDLAEFGNGQVVASIPRIEISKLKISADGHVLGLPLLRLQITLRDRTTSYGRVSRQSFEGVNEQLTRWNTQTDQK